MNENPARPGGNPSAGSTFAEEELFELRLFLEELVCNVCRIRETTEGGVAHEDLRIRQEFDLGIANGFVDILIQRPGQPGYIVEVDYGYSTERLLESIQRKYGKPLPLFEEISRFVLVICDHALSDRDACLAQVRRILPASWEFEVWDEARLLSLIRCSLDIEVDGLTPGSIHALRLAVDRAKGQFAFGVDHAGNDALTSSLLWHFGYWRVRQLYEAANRSKRSILPPGNYSAVVVIFADLSGFSGYVRETPRRRTIHDCLGAYCAKARYQIINEGGMLYQFLGDGVIGMFGIPSHSGDYIERSLDCARSLLAIGDSVSNEWQRQLDRIQPVRGCHIGMAIGDLQILSMRPFSRTHIGAIGDVINMAARLASHATSGQIVASNLLYQSLAPASRRQFVESEPVEARNVGRIKAWTYTQPEGGVVGEG